MIPVDLTTISGTWGAVHDTGEMTYMNLVHLAECDGTDPSDLTHFEMEGRRQAMLAIDALREYAWLLWYTVAKLWNDDRHSGYPKNRCTV